MDINLTDAVNRQLCHLASEAFKQKERDYGYFHASSWDKCHRQQAYHYYHAKGFIDLDDSSLERVIDPVLERIFDNGHSLHARWRVYFERSGAMLGCWKCNACQALYGQNKKLGILRPSCCEKCGAADLHYQEVGFRDDETMWGGHVDAVIDVAKYRKYQLSFINSTEMPQQEITNSEDKYIVVDFKSMNPRQFRTLEGPLPDHITQMQIYLYLSGLRYGKFVYEDKATQNVKEFLVTRDDNLLAVKKEEAIWLKFVVTNVDDKGARKLPTRAYKERTHRECVRCKFRGHCWKGE